MPPVPRIFVTLPIATVGRIFFYASDMRAARSVAGTRDSSITSDAKGLPPLPDSILAALRTAELRETPLGTVAYSVLLKGDDPTMLRDWLRGVAPLLKSTPDQALFLTAAQTIDEALRQP